MMKKTCSLRSDSCNFSSNNELEEEWIFSTSLKELRIYSFNEDRQEIIPIILHNEFDHKQIINDYNQALSQNLLCNLIKNIKDFHRLTDKLNKIDLLDNLHLHFSNLGTNGIKEIVIPLIGNLSIECEQVKIFYLSNVNRKLVNFLKLQGHEGYDIIKHDILKTIINYPIENNSLKFLDSLMISVISIAEVLNTFDVVNYIIPFVLTFSFNKSLRDYRIFAVKMFYKLSEILGQEFTKNYLISQISSLADDEDGLVRSSIISQDFISLCILLPLEIFYAKILPLYMKLAKDPDWRVKRSSVEILPFLCKLCSEDIKMNYLIDIYKSFTFESNKWIRLSTIQIIGRFVSNYTENNLNNYILEYYIDLVDECYNNPSSEMVELDFIFHLAYNFPAILKFYGKFKWEKLKKTFNYFCRDKDIQIKKIIASSFGEIAKILESEIVEKDLKIIFDYFLEDNFVSKDCVFKSLSMFISYLDYDLREDYFFKIRKFTNIYSNNWRQRKEVCKLIFNFDKIFDNFFTYHYVFPSCIKLCLDDIAEVRNYACKKISKYFPQFMIKNDEFTRNLYKILQSFALNSCYKYRQSFILMCYKLFDSNKCFDEKFLYYLNNLSSDRINSVRITLAELVSNILKGNTEWKNNIQINKIAYKLIKDKSKTVRDYFKDTIIIKEGVESESNENLNHLFICDMEFVYKEFGIFNYKLLNSRECK